MIFWAHSFGLSISESTVTSGFSGGSYGTPKPGTVDDLPVTPFW